MGKKKANGEYNDFLDGEKLRDNAGVRTSLQTTSSATKEISPPPVRQSQDQRGGKSKGKGKGGPKKPPLTHFLCLPLVTDTSRPQLQSGLDKLKDELTKENVIPPKAVRPVGTLHLTLGVMSLDQTKLEEAKQYLQDLNLHSLLRDISMQKLAEQAAEDGTIAENFCSGVQMPDSDALTINLESLVPMQAPHKTSILYAEPRDKTQRLGVFAEEVRSSADLEPTQHNGDAEAGAEDTHSQDTNEEQASSAAGSSSSHGPEAKSWLRFDARHLIDSYKHFVWADEVRVDRVQICKMGAQKIYSEDSDGVVVDERYEVVAAKGIDDW
ncbi:hypothetical protein N0V83_005865 [Neocucurbitaria cava]|uniref:A-kinase anchor protein 7-like phosphoesterase domain-containing protein n=1 Tax=Neocucurbitaria cava TaxID=798079 RepID=A0A9W8Y8G0_9PLEO|nr:hypothetical protein N0V83_005865 [Neocucurbitaria cava]